MRYKKSSFLAFALLLTSAIHAQTATDRPIQLLVGFPPGGGVDIVARQLAEKLSIGLGQKVVVENKAGASGNLAMEYVARAKPDGHTLLMGNLGMLSANPYLYPKLPFDSSKDFAPIARVVVTPFVAVVPTVLPANNLKEFVELARSKPGSLNFGSGGNGNSNHLAVELLKLQTQVQMQHIPYKGSAPALTDLATSRIQLMIDGGNVVQPFIKDGRAKAIVLTGATRSPAFPDLATSKESGMPDFVIYGWQGVLAPAGTPSSIIDRISLEIQKALANPELKSRLSSQGTEPAYQSPQDFKNYIQAEQKRWSEVIKAGKITLD